MFDWNKELNKKIEQRLKSLPKKPGVYLYRNKNKRVIYVGKAVSLKNRISSYFTGKITDAKTSKLVEQIEDMEWLICDSEIEALLLESELIKRYKPKYNIDWKDDKNYCYIKINNNVYPRVLVVRQVTDDKSQYFGPFVDSGAVRSSLKFLRRVFPYCTCGLPEDKVCLYYHLGLCLGHGEKYIKAKDYRTSISGLIGFLRGNKENIVRKLKSEMLKSAKTKDFETAAHIRDRLLALEKVKLIHLASQRDMNLDQALAGLRNSLDLKQLPLRIECFDISNISGKFAVGSMVVFENGLPIKNDYRRFEIKTVTQINDFAMLVETIKRRFAKIHSGKDKSFAKKPDLVVIDGGKGQLSVVTEELKEVVNEVTFVGLAKKREEVFSIDENKAFRKTIFPENSEARFLLQRVRDEAHRFAITYHRNIRSKALIKSVLDPISGVGPVNKKRLIGKFGTIKNIQEASQEEIAVVVGENLARKIKKEL